MTKKMILEGALALEAYHGVFTTKDGKEYPFDQGRVYQFGEDFPRVQLLKLADADAVGKFKDLQGKKHNIVCEVDERYGKQKLIFKGVQ